MRLFFISDIHANQFALETILKTAIKLKSDRIYCAGDVSGYFTGINEVIDLLIKYKVETILGNHDELLIKPSLIHLSKSYYNAFVKSNNSIGNVQYEWLSKLRNHAKFEIDNFKFEMYHGGPNDYLNEYVYPDKINTDIFKNSTSELIIFGHTHLQFSKKIDNKIFANPGSVGLPRNGDFRAHGLLFDTKSRKISLLQIPYDVNKFLLKLISDIAVNKHFIHNINFGRSSSKLLSMGSTLFFDKNTISFLKSNKIKIINTVFGAIVSFLNFDSLKDLLYISKYQNDEIVISSSTIIFNWQISNKLINDKFIDKDNCFKKDMAGVYYYKSYSGEEFQKENILNLIMEAFLKINQKKHEK